VLLDTVRDFLEVDLDVMARNALEALMRPRIGDAEPFQAVEAEAAMRELGMHGVDGVLLALQPVARDHGGADLAEAILHHEQVPARQQRPRLRPEPGPDEAAELLDRIGGELDALREIMLAELGGLGDALTALVVEPAVIGAAQPLLLGNAAFEIDAAMGA